ncbi:MAG: hypothetical protein AAFR61_27140 [Bacteroidota bacterium]
MKRLIFLASLCFALTLALPTATQAQVVVVRPKAPAVILKPEVCGPQSVWVAGHWDWNRRTKSYVWVKGRCVSKRRGFRYAPGQWKRVRGGWRWVPGGWVRVRVR